MLVEVEDLRVTLHRNRRAIHIIDGVSFVIEAGETLGVVGESGCGKSMTALSMMRLLPPVMEMSGAVRFQGVNLATISKEQMRNVRGNEFSMIFQEPLTSLNPLHTIGKQIGEALMLHTELSKEARRARAIELLKDVGLPRAEELVNDLPHQLSGGMRQRVMIAMAMACNPKLLICDEPTTALDVTVQAQILDLMRKLKNEHQMAVMMITHDLGVIAEVCDRVMVMYAGKVVEEADVVSLFEQPQHPYTQGLMKSIPRLEEESDYLGSIPGTVPLPEQMPVGCRFADRCEHVMAHCRNVTPPRQQVGNNHYVSCWLYTNYNAAGSATDSTSAPMRAEIAGTASVAGDTRMSRNVAQPWAKEGVSSHDA